MNKQSLFTGIIFLVLAIIAAWILISLNSCAIEERERYNPISQSEDTGEYSVVTWERIGPNRTSIYRSRTPEGWVVFGMTGLADGGVAMVVVKDSLHAWGSLK
jgi:hypothetical protein